MARGQSGRGQGGKRGEGQQARGARGARGAGSKAQKHQTYAGWSGAASVGAGPLCAPRHPPPPQQQQQQQPPPQHKQQQQQPGRPGSARCPLARPPRPIGCPSCRLPAARVAGGACCAGAAGGAPGAKPQLHAPPAGLQCAVALGRQEKRQARCRLPEEQQPRSPHGLAGWTPPARPPLLEPRALLPCRCPSIHQPRHMHAWQRQGMPLDALIESQAVPHPASNPVLYICPRGAPPRAHPISSPSAKRDRIAPQARWTRS
jgi:hypothetical protein